jgi:prepilin-type N-terminal cleavage/methylation domain-containing protein
MKSPSIQKSLFQNRSGFTLIELIFVMGITVIVFGAAAFMIATPKVEQNIRENLGGIEDFALQARAMSYSYQQPFVVELREGEVRMEPLAKPEDERAEEVEEELGIPPSLKPLDSMSWPRVFKIDPQYELWVKRWNSDSYKVVRGETVERWVHQPNSPCEPLAVQLITEDRTSYLSRTFHPLTAKATDEEMVIGKPE